MRGVSKLLTYRTDAAFALHKFKSNGADGGIKFAFQIGDVVEANELHARYARRKRRPIFFFVRGRQSAEGPSVESMFQGENPPLRFLSATAIGLSISPGQFKSPFPRFRAAVGEECPVHAGDLRQRGSQP